MKQVFQSRKARHLGPRVKKAPVTKYEQLLLWTGLTSSLSHTRDFKSLYMYWIRGVVLIIDTLHETMRTRDTPETAISRGKKTIVMVRSCCVTGCTNRSHPDSLILYQLLLKIKGLERRNCLQNGIQRGLLRSTGMTGLQLKTRLFVWSILLMVR